MHSKSTGKPRISFSRCFAEHIRDIIKHKDYEPRCVECRMIIERLNKFLKNSK